MLQVELIPKLEDKKEDKKEEDTHSVKELKRVVMDNPSAFQGNVGHYEDDNNEMEEAIKRSLNEK